jgi:hypothetical protein
MCWNTKTNEDKTQAIYFPHRLGPREAHLTMNGQNISFVKHVKYLGVIFNMKTTHRLHTETTDAKAFRTFIRICSLFKSERLSAKLAADTYLLKLQSLQNMVLRTTGTFQCAHQSAICTWFSTFPMYTII